MNKLDIIRKSKSLFMKWGLDGVVNPFSDGLKNGVFMSDLSKWRKENPVTGYNDFYQETWDYERRYNLYEAIGKSENLFEAPVDYLEFGVAGGYSFKWWLDKNKNERSGFLVLIHLKDCRKNGALLKKVLWLMLWNR